MKRTTIIVAALAFLGSIAVFILNSEIQKHEIALKVQKMETAYWDEKLKEQKIQIGSKREQTVKKSKEQKIQIGSKPEQTVKESKEQKIQIGSKPEQTVKKRLEFDYAKISKELHPSLDLSCTHNLIKPTETIKNVVIIDCMFKNNGVHKVFIVPHGITMFEHMEQKMIDNAIESTDRLYPTISVPDNNGNRSQYKIILTEYGAARCFQSHY